MARRAVVTGASSGIGEATVRLFRERGWEVLAVARREDRLRQIAAETGATWFRADVTSDADMAALRAHVEETGPIHALVNNAGGAFGLDSVEAGSIDDWQRMFDVNVLGTKRAISGLLPSLRAGAKDAGSGDIVTVTSIAGHIAYENGGGYNAAKFAEHALVAALRLELNGEPLRVIEIAPGMVKTDFSLVRFDGDQARADAVYDGVVAPLTADDIAESIVHSVELPAHVNLDVVTIKPVAQAQPYKLTRGELTTRD
ncbi:MULTISPECIES: SDR family oxidoreductase [unclassified Frondihabitans]|uniref:SDR family oxidoreductase n=1 Tax=unclassified Frondihabitans TaxID=2626248 RepID=UPI000F4D374E|nr:MULTISPECIES: SDR family NAD(P)-dependent oxidoreductase [unclassified Frondihabitans]RPE74490.1 NADP-dependent 3-hydroxy acid dehydrogenase YdfG [Frondihabitans sp. PhB153]RPF02919.1 NADP-dependent 3-hydroxy acid dehydrogenase YdfG [Frondihabitans sp. PhB161]